MMDSYISLENLNDEDLVEYIEKIKKDNKILEMENQIFENFLGKVDPKALIGIQAILEQAGRIQEQLDLARSSSSDHPDTMTMTKLSMSTTIMSTSSIRSLSVLSSQDSSKRINLPTKMELLNKEQESFEKCVERYYQHIKLKRNNLRAELEEINTRISETQDAREIFEHSIVKNAVDPLTQRIPADKFIRYMEEWLKCADSTIEKLRLRSCTLKYKKIFLLNQLKQKEELGESLHPVDLDQLQIDHRVLNKKLEKKNIDLLDLKKKSGKANLTLNTTKRFLYSQTKVLSEMTNGIKRKQKIIKDLEKAIDQVEKEVNISEEKLYSLELYNEKYIVPDLVDYLRQNSEMFSLQQNIKMWKRRNKIQQSALDTSIKTMKRLTHRNMEDPSWFDPPQIKNEDECFDGVDDNEDY